MDTIERTESLEYIVNAYGKYRNLFHKGKSIMLILDPETGSIIDANMAASNFYGYSIKELKSMNINQINVYESGRVKVEMQKVIDNEEEHFFFKHRLANGNVRDVEVYSGKVESNDKLVLYSIVHDITESKRNADRFKAAERIANIGSWEYNVTTKNFYASEGARRIYGLLPGDLSVDIIQQKVLPEYKGWLINAMKKLLYEGIPYDIEFKINGTNKDELIDIRSIARYDKDSNLVTGVIQDITESKKIEEDLRRAKEDAEESDRLKSAFLSIVSHELRTPLNAIIGLSDLIKDGDDLMEIREMNNIINSSGYRLLEIIETLLEISLVEIKKYKINKERFCLLGLFEELQKCIKEEDIGNKDVDIVFKPMDNHEAITIYTDFYKLKKVLKNLLSNAIKFTEQGAIEYGYIISNDNIVFYVKDTGRGIPEDKQAAIFESFRQLDESLTRKYEGIGLGLTVCKRISEVLGADLWLKSKQGEGATFYFRLKNVKVNYYCD